MFLFGANSLPDPDVEELERKGIPVRILSGVGHNMAYEDPSQLAWALADFMAACPAALMEKEATDENRTYR